MVSSDKLKYYLLLELRSIAFFLILIFLFWCPLSVSSNNVVEVKENSTNEFFEPVSRSVQNNASETPLLAFPGADGWGRYTTGGRGGEVIYVTNRNGDGPGSLRDAVRTNLTRTVVFSVSGTIELKSTLRINRDNLTIAGQTAPGDGITIKGRPVNISANNIIIRHLRFRSGDYVEDDSFKGTDQRDIIIDHCSMSWGVDEVASFYRNENFTMQNCIVSESLYRSIHSKGDHGYGGIWGGNKASFLRNLIAHHSSRTPRFNGARYTPVKDDKTDFRNNVIYNWGSNNVYGGDPNETWGTKANINIVNNYYKPGPATNSGQVAYRVVEPYGHSSFGYSLFYVDGNEVHGYPDVYEDNWGLGVQNVPASEKDDLKVDNPFEHLITETLSASDAYEFVLENAGARLPRFDNHDTRLMEETRTGNATFGGVYKGPNTGIIDKPDDVGGWIEMFSAPAPLDTDGDGMPDEWEIAHGIDPNDPSDRNDDMHGHGYTNLEYYLNSIEAQANFVRPPTQLSANATDVTEISLEWVDNSDLEEGFYIERKANEGGFELIDTLAANTTGYIDSQLDENTEYTYRLRAFGEAGNSVYSNEAGAATHSANAVPTPVSNPYPSNNAENVSTGAMLAWDNSMGAESYDVYFGETSPPPFVGNQPETNYNATIQPGKTYYWRVEAVNDIGATNEERTWTFTVREKLPPQLVGHWSLDSYSNLIDSSDFANHGTAVNVGFAASVSNAPHNRAINFNGSDQFIHIPHGYEFDFESNSFTISFWLKQNTSMINESTVQPYVFKGDFSSDPSSPYYGKRWEVFSIPASNKFVFQISDGDNTSNVEADVEPFINGKWVHVAAIRDRQNEKLYVYANGERIAEAEDGSGDLAQYEDLFFAHRPHDEAFCKGAIDDVRLYNYAFTESELQDFLGLSNATDFNMGNFKMNVFPNPASNFTTIGLPFLIEDKLSALRIFDATGRLIISEMLESFHLEKGYRLKTNGMGNGTYIVQLATEKRVFNARLLIVGK
jgi:hypothetical protein